MFIMTLGVKLALLELQIAFIFGVRVADRVSWHWNLII